MPRWLRRTFIAIAWVLMATFAYTPTVETSLVREDFDCLAAAAELSEDGLDRPAQLYRLAGAEGHPLAALSLYLSHRTWSDDGDWSRASVLPLRLEQVFLVLAAALGLALFVRRLLAPWMGSEQAEAAAWAAALFTSLHPFHLAAVASLSSRDDLLGTALGSWASVAFLSGRQERRYALLVVAGLLSFAAALSSSLAFGVPALLGLTEFVSAHRYRPLAKRRQTAVTTVLVFGGCVALAPILGTLVGVPDRPLNGAGIDWLTGMLIAVEKLGLLLLPINVSLMGVIIYPIAGALVLLAVQPALIAARSSPRQWGWILCAWTAFLVASGVHGFTVRVQSADLSQSAVLYPTATVMAIGLAVSATALPGLRRWLNTLGLACCFAILAHMNGLPWKHASQAVETLRADLRRARAQHGDEIAYVVLDLPTRVERIDGLGGSLAWLTHPPFARGTGARVRALPLAAFGALVRERDATEFRDEPFVVLVPQSEVSNGSSWRTSLHDAALMPPPAAPSEPPRWGTGARSPDLDLDPRSVRGLEAVVPEPGPRVEAPRLAWRTVGPTFREGRLAGVWTADGRARFDLFDAPAWLMADRVRRIWSDEGWTAATEVRLLGRLPRVEENLAPRPIGDDWHFDVDVDEDPGGREHWTLELIELEGLTFERLDVVRAAAGGLVAAGAEEWTRRVTARGGATVAWTLARRRRSEAVEPDAAESGTAPLGVALAESSGHRRVTRADGSVEIPE